MAFLFWLGIRGARNAVVRPNAFCGAKAPLFLHAMQKTQENAIGTEAAQPPEYPAYRSTFLSRKSAAFL